MAFSDFSPNVFTKKELLNWGLACSELGDGGMHPARESNDCFAASVLRRRRSGCA